MTDLPAIGLHRNIPHDTYSAWPALRFSTLKCFLTGTPAHAQYRMLNPPEGESLDLGQSVHCAVLEPAEFEKRYVVAPKLDRRTNAGKAAWAEFQSQNAERIALVVEDYDKCMAMAAGARKNAAVRALLDSAGHREVSLLWHERASTDEPEMKPLPMKARVDILLKTEAGIPTMVDLKTCAALDESFLTRQFYGLGYDVQAAHYLAGAEALAPVNRDWIFICIENKPPHLARPVRLSEQLYLEGVRRREMCIAKYVQAVDTDNWPGYPNAALELRVPDWVKPEAIHAGDE